VGNRAWKYWLIASILAAALWAAGWSKAEENGQPKAFNSGVAFDVCAVVGKEPQLIGSTPSERAVTIPPCRWWYVEPLPPVDMEKVRQEVEAQGIPGLILRDATDADLEHLKGLTGLQVLVLSDTQVTDAGLEHLKGLTGLQYLHLWGMRVTDAGLEHLKALTRLQVLVLSDTQVTDAGLEYLKGLTALRELWLPHTQVTPAGVEQLKKYLPNVVVKWS
jgi:hypothetical protein